MPGRKPPKAPKSVETPTTEAQSWVGEASELFSVGHQPQVTLSAEQERLFKSFQSNLVSLLSHELRTPLMGIQNALSALDGAGEPLGGLSTAEALAMARDQSQKLDSALSTVLDLAAWEAGNLQVDLREGDFSALASSVFGTDLSGTSATKAPGLRLLDLGRARRALERLKVLLSSLGSLQVTQTQALVLEVKLADEAAASLWDVLWHEAQVARAAHASLPLHVFAGVLQSEQGFLARTREGLGAELHLVAQIFAQHEAHFEAKREALRLRLELKLPEISGRSRVIQVIRSRIWRPGLAEPEALYLRAHSEPPRDLPVGSVCYPLDPGQGPWVEIGSAMPSGQRKWVRSPEDGVDATLLLDAALKLAP